jgi:hypothetical protein
MAPATMPPAAPRPAAATVMPPAAAQPVPPRPAAGGSARPPAGWRAERLVWFCSGVVTAFLALDFLLQLAGAIDVGFAHIVFAVGGALTVPFSGIFPAITSTGRYALRWDDLLALIVYGLLAWAVVALVRIAARRDGTTTTS